MQPLSLFWHRWTAIVISIFWNSSRLQNFILKFYFFKYFRWEREVWWAGWGSRREDIDWSKGSDACNRNKDGLCRWQTEVFEKSLTSILYFQLYFHPCVEEISRLLVSTSDRHKSFYHGSSETLLCYSRVRTYFNRF